MMSEKKHMDEMETATPELSGAAISRAPEVEIKKKAREYFRYALFFLLMLVILAATFHFLLKGSSIEEIRRSLASAKASWIAVGFALMIVHQLCVAVILRLLLGMVTKRHIPWWICANTSFIGFYFNNLTPSSTGGQPMEIYYLYRCGVRVSGSSMVFIAMSVFYNFVVLVLGTVMLIWQGPLVLPSLFGIKYVLVFGYLFNGGLFLLCLFLIFNPEKLRRFIRKVMRALEKKHLLPNRSAIQRRVDRFLDGYSAGAAELLRSWPLLCKLLLLHFVQVLALYLVPYAVGRSLGAGPELFLPALALQSVLNLAVSGFPTPGAVGLTESGFVAMFSSVFPQAKVYSAMILTRVIHLYAFLILSGFISIVALSLAGKGRHKLPEN